MSMKEFKESVNQSGVTCWDKFQKLIQALDSYAEQTRLCILELESNDSFSQNASDEEKAVVADYAAKTAYVEPEEAEE